MPGVRSGVKRIAAPADAQMGEQHARRRVPSRARPAAPPHRAWLGGLPAFSLSLDNPAPRGRGTPVGLPWYGVC
jgi:hypothetical protein